MEYKAQFGDDWRGGRKRPMRHRGAKGILFTDQIGSFQRKSGLDRVECAGSNGKRREKLRLATFPSTLHRTSPRLN